MELKEEIVQENFFRADFNIDFRGKHIAELRSADYCFKRDAVSLQFQAKMEVHTNNAKKSSFYVKFSRRRLVDGPSYTIKLTITGGVICNSYQISHSMAPANHWQLFYTFHDMIHLRFTVTGDVTESELPEALSVNNAAAAKNNVVAASLPPGPITFAELHDDDELTDFELHGANGGVYVHRVALAAASPVLRSMLAGDWREAAQGYVDLPDVSLVTLQHFKDYIYKNLIPASGAEHLLLLASRYMMTDLEQQCVHRLLNSVSGANAVDLIEFATKHKMTDLLIDLLERVEIGKLKVQAIRNNNKSK